ncbi:MAG: minor capsid protein [Clostridia bacterium]|nr:minor capsid protein [Clostridia bacterium]
MANKNSEYWQQRFGQLENASHQEAMTVYSRIEESFYQAQREIENKINSWYVRFANNNEMTINEAKKLLNSNELKEFKWDVQEYIKYGHENELNEHWMKELENASTKYHVSRLEALKIQTQQTMEKLFGNELDEVDNLTKNSYINNYFHTMFEYQKGFNIGFNVTNIDQNKLSKIVNKPWAVDEKNFSERIWGNKTKLINELHNELTKMCLTGKSPDESIKYLSKKFNTSKAQAGNLIMTENAYFSQLAQKDCFNALDVEKYEIVATLDSHTSEICKEQDGKVYNMKDYQPGITAPPFHNYCRSTTVPHFDDDFDDEGERAAKGEDGKTYYVSDKMKYEDWYNKYVQDEVNLKNTPKNDKINISNNEIVKQLKDLKIEYNPVQKLDKSLTTDEIVQKISGGDMTKGSCSSLGFAYIANKNGLDVLDFRGGSSQDFFSTTSNIYKISQLPGVKSIVAENTNDIMATTSLLKTLEEGKEYYLATGNHAAIVRKIENTYEFLELQSPKENGFKQLTTNILKNRFHCKQTHSIQGIKFKTKNILMEVDSFKDNSEFEEIMGYINTSENKQIKGVKGSEK